MSRGGPAAGPPADPAANPAGDLPAGLAPLLTDAGRALLATLPPYREADALALADRLRAAGHPPELVAAALTQAKLRARARAKFGAAAERMLLTEAGLEQATRPLVADRHADRFAGAALSSVADLGCGIGADALAFARAGLAVTAVDRDPAAVACARANLAAFPDAQILYGDATAFAANRCDGLWFDPARREGSARRLDVEASSPPLSHVLAVARGHRTGAVGVKLSPAVPHHALPPDAEAQWTSVDGDLVEACLWFGPLARDGARRTATVVQERAALDNAGQDNAGQDNAGQDSAGQDSAGQDDAGQDPGVHELTGSAAEEDPEPIGLGAVLLEPDPAVIRAGLLGPLAARLGAGTIDPTIAYLTAEDPPSTPFARAWRVREVLPLHGKALNAYLRAHRIGVLEIKKRGVDLTPEQLRAQLKPRRFGDEAATLIATRLGGKRVAILADPIGR